MTHLAFVSAPGGSLFMEELLSEVAATVQSIGGSASCHSGSVADVVSDDCIAVIVPHEYYALTTPPSAAALRRTIGFGVEHPGTQSFENSARVAGQLARSFEISDDSLHEMRRRGVRCERFVLGYNPRWEFDRAGAARDIDVVHLGTADENRLAALAPIAADLAWHRTKFLLPPHEWMDGERPDFVIGERKHALLRRSRLLLNLHRESSTAFEWVRALDSIRNGCVVLTAPSEGLAPLIPGEHILVARPDTMSGVAIAALRDPEALSAMAEAAFQLCRSELNMAASATRLVQVADGVASAVRSKRTPLQSDSPENEPQHFYALEAEKHLAFWVPCERAVPSAEAPGDPATAHLLREVSKLRRAQLRPDVSTRKYPSSVDVDVLCVRRLGDGPLSLTLDSLAQQDISAALHLGSDGAGTVPESAGSTSIVFCDPVGRSVIRNLLLERGHAPYVLVVDPGDELLGRGMSDALTILQENSEIDIAYPMAVLGSGMIVNVLVPEARRLDEFPYLGRGFLVRRAFLERLGGFAEDAELEDFADYEFWIRAVDAGAQAALVPQVGIRLWQQQPALSLRDVDPGATLARLRRPVPA